jgi:flavin reductase (DIM6/NTAB) family NADH-FMN oxidoreductase RutF
MQCSFDPPLVAVEIKRGTRTFDMVKAAGAFVIHVTGAPILANLPGYLECRVVERVDRGDHPIFIAEVVEAGVQSKLLALRDMGWN